MILVFGKARSHRAPNLGCRGTESPGWFDVSQKSLHETWCMSSVLWWWSCQLPVAQSCSLLNHLKSFLRGMFKLNAKFAAYSLLYLLSHFECYGNTVPVSIQRHLPSPLTSTVKSSLFTHVYSSPLSLAARLHPCHTNCSHYINNGRTDLVYPQKDR